MFKHIIQIVVVLSLGIASIETLSNTSDSSSVNKNVLEIHLEVPDIDAHPYHKPYIAVWLETPQREPVTTIALWAKETDWYKDLRQWWRKLGRDPSVNYDGVTGATRRPGQYKIHWDGKDNQGRTITPGPYLLNIEASREEGGRSYVRETINLGEKTKVTIPAEQELGSITIIVE
ncbi:hypothetical protein TDB9533_00743 [Thalassocella blandensis]|nr:hypothetical protein TDB9533_00743 [Thalassocella blandensis]